MASCGSAHEDVTATIITLERGALDRWGKGDVGGYLAIYGPDINYFDPALDNRIDGHDAIEKYLTPFQGKIGISHYEMIDPKVQLVGDVAVLTYRLVDDVTLTPAGPAKLQVRWNCTQVYARRNGEWKIIHNHWAYTKPELKPK